MIDPTRITHFQEVLDRSASVIPSQLKNFFLSCRREGFDREDAFELTKVFMQAILAVPSQPELPQQTNNKVK